jgi:SAM-dependent methyltransferase
VKPIKYDQHYTQDYFTGGLTYKDSAGKPQQYHGPGLVWHGFQYVADALCNLIPFSSVVDIGCGGGDLLHRLLKAGKAVSGIDISEWVIAHADPEVRPFLHCGDITQSWTHAGFDLVMATDLLEHIYEEDLPNTFDFGIAKTDIQGQWSPSWFFFCVATASGDKSEFVLKKGQPVPPEYEGVAVAGHVNVRTPGYWLKFFRSRNLKVCWDRMYAFQMAREARPDWRTTGGWNMANTWILTKE